MEDFPGNLANHLTTTTAQKASFHWIALAGIEPRSSWSTENHANLQHLMQVSSWIISGKQFDAIVQITIPFSCLIEAEENIYVIIDRFQC